MANYIVLDLDGSLGRTTSAKVNVAPRAVRQKTRETVDARTNHQQGRVELTKRMQQDRKRKRPNIQREVDMEINGQIKMPR